MFGPTRDFVDRGMRWPLTLSVVVVFAGALLLALNGRVGLALAISVLVGCVSLLAKPPLPSVPRHGGARRLEMFHGRSIGGRDPRLGRARAESEAWARSQLEG